MKASPRKWQSQCIEIALEHYTTMPHFFCQATPGAGKTRMAAELARHLLEQGKIDLVLCFALFRSVSLRFAKSSTAFARHSPLYLESVWMGLSVP
jgi:DNA polymerase III delta prime subunit